MKTRTFRIGSNDYQVTGYAGGNSGVKIKKIAREGEVQEGGKDYATVEEAVEAIRNQAVEKYKKIVLDMPAAHSMVGDQEIDHGSRFAMAHKLYTGNGKAKSAGFMVIFAENEDLSQVDYFHSTYCRSKAAAEELSVESLKPEVTETTDFGPDAMFQLDHGMSWERYMSM